MSKVSERLKTTGWLILITSQNFNVQKSYDIYRQKDVVEKAFFCYKNVFGFEKPFVQKDKRSSNKGFIIFIALILDSYIRKQLKESKEFKTYRVKDICTSFKKIKAFINDEKIIVRTLTAEQKNLLDLFKVPHPKTEIQWDKYQFIYD
jgi:transposase